MYDVIFAKREYAFSAKRPDPVIVDGGANIGLASIFWKREYPSARIVAYEADPAIASVALANLMAAGASDVTVESAALWVNDGCLKFDAQGGAGGLISEFGVSDVTAVRLRDVITNLDSVDLLKLDIEGAETAVIEDCAEVLPQVDLIAMEYHSRVGQPQRLGQLLSTLEIAGYRLSLRAEFAPINPFLTAETRNGFDLQLNIWAYRL